METLAAQKGRLSCSSSLLPYKWLIIATDLAHVGTRLLLVLLRRNHGYLPYATLFGAGARIVVYDYS